MNPSNGQPIPISELYSDLPEEIRRHTLMAGKHFFGLPRELLEAVVERVGECAFDKETLAIDRMVSERCGDFSGQVGYRCGVSIRFDGLAAPLSLAAAVADLRNAGLALGWSHGQQNTEILTELDQHTAWANRTARAYVGWLVLNPQFVNEQRAFITAWQQEIIAFGYDGPRVEGVAGELAHRYAPFADARAAFKLRWHLAVWAGPCLMQPERPHFPSVGSADITALPIHFSLPGVYPLPSAEALPAMIASAMARTQLPEHLAEWADIIANGNVGKKNLLRFERIFLLQHYWRALYSRHAEALYRNKGRVIEAFSSFLRQHDDVDDTAGGAAEVVKKDLALIEKVHGPQWPLDH